MNSDEGKDDQFSSNTCSKDGERYPTPLAQHSNLKPNEQKPNDPKPNNSAPDQGSSRQNRELDRASSFQNQKIQSVRQEDNDNWVVVRNKRKWNHKGNGNNTSKGK